VNKLDLVVDGTVEIKITDIIKPSFQFMKGSKCFIIYISATG
jgi:hypothetical protein